MRTVIRFMLAVALAVNSAGAVAGQDKASKQLTVPVGHVVTLSWTASTSTGVTYNMYISVVSGGPYTKINSGPISGLTYQDLKAISGNTYYYVATAVDSTGNESVNSNEVKVIIPTP